VDDEDKGDTDEDELADKSIGFELDLGMYGCT
jgi:hypothetical protein